ncbi:MAG TPA: DUF1592 domain-containing protein, partial [Myxococcus sp.]|jgi:hypothetical protein|nr:DUF1592 domain-containing protein [Myxococcus sp.]
VVEATPPEPSACAPAPGPSPLRRLTHREYDNTLRDLLGDTSAPSQAFPAEEELNGFTNNAATQTLSPVLAEKYMLAAMEVAERATQNLGKLLPCDPAKVGEEACARRFIQQMGTRAFRRPLTQASEDQLFAVYAAGRASKDFRTGIQLALEVMLQSPEFLYLLEDGTPVDGRPTLLELDGWSMASRLSYLLWGTLPDKELFDAAEEGRLSTPDELAAQARRMLKDPRARGVVREFHAQWLGLGRISELAKDTSHFPAFNPDIRSHLRAEADAFVDHVVFEGEGTLKELFTAPYTFVDAPLAAYYGLTPPRGQGMVKVDLPTRRGAGLLSQGGLMAVLAKPTETSPILRGKFVRERLLCQMIPPPPDNAVIAPNTDPNATAREKLAEHRKDPSCGGCHIRMDPIGFGFEKFDGIGRFREMEPRGGPVDDSGDVDGNTFRGVSELGTLLAEDPKVHSCVVKQWFRFAHGRADSDDDACTLSTLEAAFTRSNGNVQDLLINLTQTEAFRFRTAPVGSQGVTP